MNSAAISELHQEAHSLTTLGDVSEFLSDCDTRMKTKEICIEDYAELRFYAFLSLRKISEDSFNEVMPLILNDLLPWCLKTYKRSSKADINIYRCRELLGNWINELPHDSYKEVVPVILDYLVKHLKGRTFKTACWTLGAIGQRTESINLSLVDIVKHHPGKAGDHALALLLDLGMLPKERDCFIDDGIRRFRERRHNVTYYTLGMLGSIKVLEAIDDEIGTYLSGDAKKAVELLGVLARIAEHAVDDVRAVDLAAHLVQKIYALNENEIASRLAMACNLLPSIDSSVVGVLFSNLFLNIGSDAGKRIHAVYVRILRMRECKGIRQLDGFPSCATDAFLSILKGVLSTEGENSGSQGSLLYDTKKNALWAALAIESDAALKWLPEVLAHEQNGFIQHELMQMYACFRIHPLPELILQWITEPYDAPKDVNAEVWITRTSALRVARSAASQEAFDAVLSPGFTLGGTVLLDTVQALTESALVITNNEEKQREVADVIIDAARSSVSGPRYSAAVNALLTLSRKGRLPEEFHHTLVKLAFAENQVDYDQARLLEALYHADPRLLEPFIAQLTEWAENANNRIGEMAIELLIRTGKIDLTASIPGRLGLKKHGDFVAWSPDAAGMSRWSPFYIGLLFERSPAVFEQAILDILNQTGWQQCSQIYGSLQRAATNTPFVFPESVRGAIISRLIRKITPNQAELSLFSFAARTATDAVLNHDWRHYVEDWFADARIAFAEALRLALQRTENKQSFENGVKYLIRLTNDSQYGVRRSAFRALSVVDNSFLKTMVSIWATSKRHDIRVRAAEALGWLDLQNHEEKELHDTLAALRLDEHKLVRQRVLDAKTNQRGRSRAQEYLSILNKLIAPSNDEMLHAWRYGWALSRVADDDDINQLRLIQSDDTRAPNVRQFIELIIKAAEKQWDASRKKWPEPIIPLRGTAVESGTGKLTVAGNDFAVDYILWGEPATDPNSYARWGARCQFKTSISGLDLFGKDGELVADDGRKGSGFIDVLSGFTEFEFCGNGEYPK